MKAASEQTGGSAAGPWQDDREDMEPFDPAEVVWAPTPQIRQKMLSMRKRVCYALLIAPSCSACWTAATEEEFRSSSLDRDERHHAPIFQGVSAPSRAQGGHRMRAVRRLHDLACQGRQRNTCRPQMTARC